MRLKTSCLALGTAALLALVPSAGAATVLDTTPGWDGSSGICTMGVGRDLPPDGSGPGVPYATTYGQVVTAPAADTVLDELTFFLTQYPFGGDALVVRAEVYAWDGTRATGAAVWESAPRTLALTSDTQAVAFGTGGAGLVAGARYVVFLSVAKDLERIADGTGACLGAVAGAGSADGGLVTVQDGGDERQWTARAWSRVGDQDLALRAAFSAPAASPAPVCADLRAGASAARPATIVGTPGPDVLEGTAGADVIAGLGGDDRIRGLGGDDVVCAGAGRDRVDTGAGRDSVAGEDGADVLHTGSGDDAAAGQGAGDLVVTGDGRDLLLGGPGSDLLLAGRGDDRLSGDEGAAGPADAQDVCDGRGGSDQALRGTCERLVGVEHVLALFGELPAAYALRVPPN
jgi:Ca2+-binding RTX toxin-like protein